MTIRGGSPRQTAVQRPLLRGVMALIVLLLAGCVSRAPKVAEFPKVEDQSIFLVGKIGFDRYGRPLPGEMLAKRPGSSGDRFTVVHAIGGRPVRSYDIMVAGPQADLTRPFAVIYDWTGRGYEGGVEITAGIAPNATIRSGTEAAAYLAIKAAPIVIATATGFVVGVLASIPEMAVQLKNVVVNARETVTGRAEYSYDDRGRIRFMKLYPPEEHAEVLVKTEFIYEGEGAAPVRTLVTSVAEKKERIITPLP